MSDSTQNNTAMPDLNKIGSWSQADYELLTADFVSKMTPAQIYAMGHTSWMPDEAAAGFTAEMVQQISISMYWFKPGWVNNLSMEALQGLTPAQMGEFTANTLCGVDAAHLSTFTAEQVAGINCSFYWFDANWLNSLSIPAFQAINAKQLSGLTGVNLTGIDSAHAAALTVSQITSWTTTFYWFNSTFLNNLSTETFQAISSKHLNELTSANFLKLDNQHLAALTAAQVAASSRIGDLTSEQFGYLDISQLPVSAIEKLSKTEYQGLTAKQVSTFSAEQIQAMKSFDLIPAAAIKGFTPVQIAGFGDDLSLLPAAFLNNLDTAMFAAFTPAQLRTLSPATFAALNYQHFWTIHDLPALSDVMSSLSTDQLLTVSQLMSIEQIAQLPESQNSLINTSVETGFALVDRISDPALKELMHNAVTNDASLFSFQSIESVLKDFAAQLTGNLSANQYGDIKNYVQEIGNVCGTDSAIYSLVNGLIGTSGASINWTATGPGERIGSLAAGSSVTQFNQLISTWFDGANAPASSSMAHVEGRPLFAKGGPSINDITQGGVSDCALLSALQAVVNIAPDFIKSMIVENPNNTYSVRFFNKGEPHWVTVDGNVCSYGENSANSSWAAIVERANVAFEATYMNDINNYSSLGGGHIKMEEITGDTLTSFRALVTSEEKWDTTNFEILKTAVLNGAPAQLSSWANSKNTATGQTNFVSGHAFGIIGFDESTQDFILSNPWGAYRNDNVQGTFEASMDEMWQKGNFSTNILIANINDTSGAAGPLVHAMAAMNTSPSAALTHSALPNHVNNGTLAASHA